MKMFCCVVATAGLLISAPAMAQQVYDSGSGFTNIWSSAQGTANSYGGAKALGKSSSGSIANTGGRGTLSAGVTSAITGSNAVASSLGSGYAQTQTSGYAGGSISGSAGRSR
jgi:hypothetical protein